MPELQRLFSERRQAFEGALAQTADSKAAYDECVRIIGELRRAYISETQDGAQRVRLNELMSAAECGVGAMVAVSQVDISLIIAQRFPRARNRMSFTQLTALAPAACMAALGVWLLFEDAPWAALVAALSGAASAYHSLRLRRPMGAEVPDVTGVAKVDPVELARRMEHILGAIDQLMMVSVEPDSKPLALNDSLMESIQMLMEARLQDDGRYALQALPQLVASLEVQGIELMMYSPGDRQNFDLFPARQGGDTIRPALMRDGKLILRGQATIE